LGLCGEGEYGKRRLSFLNKAFHSLNRFCIGSLNAYIGGA
jgi:hypothetical protein